jgi:hypothetical protein
VHLVPPTANSRLQVFVAGAEVWFHLSWQINGPAALISAFSLHACLVKYFPQKSALSPRTTFHSPSSQLAGSRLADLPTRSLADSQDALLHGYIASKDSTKWSMFLSVG